MTKRKELRALGLNDALLILADETAWNKWLFFTTPLASREGKTPLLALRACKKARIARAFSYLFVPTRAVKAWQRFRPRPA